MVSRRLIRASIRHLIQHRWQTTLSTISIMLGVAIVVAVGIANSSAQRAFALSLEQISGRVTHHLIAGPLGIPSSLYRRLRLEQRQLPSAPVIEGTVELGSSRMTLLGLDPLAEEAFRGFLQPAGTAGLRDLLKGEHNLWMAQYTANRLGIKVNQQISLRIANRQYPATVSGLIEHANPAALDGVLVADMATAQSLLKRDDRLDRIELILSDEQAKQLAAWLPPGVRLADADARNNAMAGMTRSFQTNLSAMSLLALLVGGFLIYNSATFSVLQRRRQFGILRLLGVSRRMLFGTILLESMLVGLVGTLLGLGFGVVLSTGLIQLVSQTINDLYFVLVVNQLDIPPLLLLQGTGLGLTVTLAAVSIPAWEASRTQPHRVSQRSVIEQQSLRLLPWLFFSGTGIMACGLYLATQPGRSLLLGFAALFLLIVGYCLAVPALVPRLSRLLQPPIHALFGTVGRLATRGIATTLSRTGPAIAALTLAIAAGVGMGIMIDSFRGSVARWLNQTMQADIYISIPHGSSSHASPSLPAGIQQQLLDTAGIGEISQGRHVQVEDESGPVNLLALEMASSSTEGFEFNGRQLMPLWPRFHQGEQLLASESYAYRHQLNPGDTIRLLTPQGFKAFTLGGIFVDYATDQGLLVIDRLTYQRHWQDSAISTIGLFINPGSDIPSLITRLEKLLADKQGGIQIRASKTILEQSLAIFDRTFTITRVLRLLVIIVAVVGILSAMMALQLERAKEHAILRATGITRLQLASQVAIQTSLMGLMAGLLALPLGWLMSEILIHVINLRAFGWSLQSQLSVGIGVQALLISLLAALLGGIYPGIKMARTSPARALREE